MNQPSHTESTIPSARPVAPPPPLGPTRDPERIQALDVLRGFALFGILLVNIGFFATGAMVFDRLRWWESPPLDGLAYLFVDFFGTYKFVSLFSMLFGIGMALQSRRADARGRPFVGLFVRRMLVLLGFGVLHGVFLWYGDILSMYAILGMVALLFRRARAIRLVILALILILMPVLILGGLTALNPTPPPTDNSWAAMADQMEAQMKSQRAASRSATTTPPETEATIELQPSEKEFLDAFRRFADFMDREVEFYGEGPWHLAVAHRAIIYLLFANLKVGLLLLGWRCMALFLFGMALVKSEIMTRPAEHRPFFLKLALIGLPIGAVVQIAGLCAPWVFGLTAWTNLSREMGLYLGGIGVALGYVGCVTLLATTPRAQSWIAPLAAAGRMALTNYIGQSVICGLIFYSLGLGLIGKIEYFWVVPLTLGIYALQLVISPLWLRVFRFGPLEWIWRSLTYLQRQPMIRQRA